MKQSIVLETRQEFSPEDPFLRESFPHIISKEALSILTSRRLETVE
jgi:hypothetical protein